MKKKVIFGVAIVTLMAVAGYVGHNANKSSNQPSMLDLSSVEAIAGCEVSSDPLKNTGYCFPSVDGRGDACITGVTSGPVRCNGNI